MRKDEKGIHFKLVIICLLIVIACGFWLSVRENLQPVNITVMPVVPREGEPVLVTFRLTNPSSRALLTYYKLYVNGELLTEGETTIPPASSETHQYAYGNPLSLGTQLNFAVSSGSEGLEYEKVVSLPSYSPQILSSFISFASMSQSMMGFMSTMSYYQSSFGGNVGLSVGIILAMVLTALLVFMELTHPVVEGKELARLGTLRIKFSTVTWILLIIFLGMLYTRMMIIIT